MPFNIPGFPPIGSLGGGSSAAPGASVVGEQIEEEMRTMPDGSVCKTTHVYQNGQLKKKTEQCGQPGGGGIVGRRRLDGIEIPFELPFGPGVAGSKDPMDELWVLGSAFLEHFVVVFDFENARMGVAQPSGIASAGSVAGAFQISSVPLIGSHPSEQVSRSRSLLYWATLAAIPVACAACAFIYARLLRFGEVHDDGLPAME
jgi:hypothetical protein